MAWVSQGFQLSITVVDSGENRCSRTYQMTAADYATATANALTVLGYFEAVCAAGTVSYSIKEVFYNDTLVVPTDSQVQIEAQALLIMRDETNPLKTHTATIPAPETDVFLAVSGDGQNIVDIAHADVLDFANMFSTAGECYISDGERIADNGLIRGRRTTRHARRG